MKTKKDKHEWVEVDKQKSVSERESFDVNGEKYTPYAVSQSYRFPLWLKACFAKWWIPGMVFYFIFFGISNYLKQDILALILGLVWGLVTDIFLNRFFRDSSAPNHDYTKYIVFGRKKGYVSLLVNLIYGVILSAIAALLINVVIFVFKIANPDEFLFGVGPLLYATFVFVFDLAFAWIRNLIEYIIKKCKQSKLNTQSVSLENSDEEDNDNQTNNTVFDKTNNNSVDGNEISVGEEQNDTDEKNKN